jgi:predicted PurR-regulated permease PerM
MFSLTPSQRQTLFWSAIGLALLVLLFLLGPVLAPFLLAAVLAYMLNPGVEALVRRKWPRALAVGLVLAVLLLLVVLLILILLPVLQREGLALQQKIPALFDHLHSYWLPWVQQHLGITLSLDAASVRDFFNEHLAQSGQALMTQVLNTVRSGGSAVLGWLAFVFLVPIVLFYLLLDWPVLLARLGRLVPRAWQTRVMGMAHEIDALLAQFLRGQISVMLALAVYYSVALALAGFDAALPIGLLTGLLVFIPYLGFGLGLVLALLSAALQFGSAYGFIAVAVIYGLGQVLESFVLTPYLVGGKIGLSPLVVIFALMAFGQLFGFVGVLIALPASAVLAVLLRHLSARYFDSDFYKQ